MNKLEIFKNPRFGSIRILMEDDGTLLFCGSDAANMLGYRVPQKAIRDNCRCVLKRNIPHPQNPDRSIEMLFIPEGDVYRLIIHSKLPAAEVFEKWVFDEVLPMIQKTGGFDIPQTLLARVC